MITDPISRFAALQRTRPEYRGRDVMTKEIKYCFDDQDVEDVIRNMGDIQVRRLPVVNP